MSDEQDNVQYLVSRRNGASVEQALRRMTALIEEQNKRLAEFAQGLSAFSRRLDELERMMALQKAASIGRGPTVLS